MKLKNIDDKIVEKIKEEFKVTNVFKGVDTETIKETLNITMNNTKVNRLMTQVFENVKVRGSENNKKYFLEQLPKIIKRNSENQTNTSVSDKLITEKSIEVNEEIIEDIEAEVIERNSPKRIKEGKNVVGIYGYFDKVKGIFIYIGKDSNILLNLRDKQHRTTGNLRIDRIIQNNPERYEYIVIDTIESTSVLVLDILERYFIKLYNTYHYENPEGRNFTKGGETSFGIETEANINYDRAYKKINSRYRGQRDGIAGEKRDIGKNGDSFVLTTNGSGIVKGKKVPKFRIENERTKGGMTSDGDIRKVIKKFEDLNFKDSELKVKKRIRNEYEDILIECGY